MPTKLLQSLNRWFKMDYAALQRAATPLAADYALNLGCGRRPISGFTNVDLFDGPGVDMVVDLDQPLPFKTASADLIYADNVFEHLQNYPGILQECRRVLSPHGRLVVDVPYFRSAGAFIDPTHRNFFTLRSMRYFVENTYESDHYAYLPVLFRKVDVLVNPGQSNRLNQAISYIASKRPELIEESLLGRSINIRSIRFVMQC
jgi:SAM-dependent methyltransferase